MDYSIENTKQFDKKELEEILQLSEGTIAPEMSIEWLTFLAENQKSAIPGTCPVNEIISAKNENNNIVALLTFVSEFNLHFTNSDFTFRWSLDTCNLSISLKGLHCRIPFSHTLSLASLQNKSGKEGFRGILNLLEKTGRKRNSDYLQISRVEPGTYVSEVLNEKGYYSFPILSDYIINIEWDSFNVYLMSLTKKKRKNIKQNIKCFLSNDVTIKVESKAVQFAEFYPLYVQTCKKYGGKPHGDPDFYEAASQLPNSLLISARTKNNIPIGFLLCYCSNNIISAKQVGIDYSSEESSYTYINICYYLIRYAIEHCIRRIHFGISAGEFKSRIGAAEVYSERKIMPLSENGVIVLEDAKRKWTQWQNDNK